MKYKKQHKIDDLEYAYGLDFVSQKVDILQNALRLWNEGNSMSLHKRPRPWEG